MWIVRLALQRPYTFIVAGLLILLLSPVMIMRTPVDIFPNINIPVISVVFDYSGMSPDEMGNRFAGNYERVLTTTVDNIEHIESTSMRGRTVVKVFFHPAVKIDMAVSQVTAVSQTMLRTLPPGSNPPLIITYNASSVPVIQLGISSEKLAEQQISDEALNFVRPQLVRVPGVGIPYPYGGKMPYVLVDLDLNKLRSKGLVPSDVVNAVGTQDLIVPGGTVKIGNEEQDVAINGSPTTIEELNNLPVKVVNGSVVYIHDVGNVRQGFQDQTNIVRENGRRAVLLSAIKTGAASTLDIVDGIRAMLPETLKNASKDLSVTAMFDQSIFVRAAITGVVREALIAACLTALMILLFLADWRATLIIAVSIPLSILCSICALSALGETINLMTLGGLALAVGILVDDATVTIENIDQHLEQGKDLRQAILDGANQIAIPAFVSTLCICIVFVPMFLLSGVARYLFVPLAEAVVFAMLASYFWSRTLVPTLAMYLLRDHAHKGRAGKPAWWAAPFVGIQRGFEVRFNRFREAYRAGLQGALSHRKIFVSVFLFGCIASGAVLFPILGQDFFPTVDAGQIKLHMRTKTGTRIEETARIADRVEHKIREIIPADQLTAIVDNIGVPYSGINTSYSNNGTFGTSDAEIMISLNEKNHEPTESFIKKLRVALPHEFPGNEFFFQPADIVSQILNFGLPSPIDIKLTGRDLEGNFAVASKMLKQLRAINGIADVHIQQAFDLPRLNVNFDRSKAAQLGVTQTDAANSVLISLSGSGQTTPAFWLNPKNGVVYSLMTKVPQYQIQTLQDLENLPIRSSANAQNAIQSLTNLADIKLGRTPAVITHYNILPSIDIYATTQGRDLGGVAGEVKKVIDQYQKEAPRGTAIQLLGQVQTMHNSFIGLGVGLIGAIVLVYLLIVVNFQSWLDPFIIITALPGALAGIAWMLFLTGTTISVPALMGAVMCVGVATANSILVVSFAKEVYDETGDATESAMRAGVTRLRPVLMTAFAMMLGMVPMAFGLGEGGEQNAPLARAVIGGLMIATVSTLYFVPVVFSILKQKSKVSGRAETTVQA